MNKQARIQYYICTWVKDDVVFLGKAHCLLKKYFNLILSG